MKKVLVTGISGFAGSHLADLLVENKDYQIFGTSISNSNTENLSKIIKKIDLREVNLLDENKVHTLIKDIKPDYIFHLAALASAADSFDNPANTINNNISAELSILEALHKEKFLDTKVLIVSSADVYGDVAEKDLPINENTKITPVNPYAVSKVAQDFLALQYFLAYKMPIIRVRPFNHIGPRQVGNFVVASFAKRIVEIEKGKREPELIVGNLEAKRDFTDVRDMVRAYKLVMEKGKIGDVYNLGYGASHKIADILDKLLSLSRAKIKVEVDKNLFRPIDTPNLVCDSTKIRKDTGWEPKIDINKTLSDTLDYWRDIV